MDHAEAMDSPVHELVTVSSTITTIACKCYSVHEKKTRSPRQQQQQNQKQTDVCAMCFCSIFSSRCFFFIVVVLRRNVSAPVKGRATNNAGEIQAAVRAIWDCANYGFDAICINSDSEFLIESVYERLDRWEQNGFYKANGDPLANRRDFMNLSRALNRNSDMDVYFQHVYAHAGDPFNEEADHLAREGARQYGQYYYY